MPALAAGTLPVHVHRAPEHDRHADRGELTGWPRRRCPPPRPQLAPRRRAFFGLFDADGWGWASVKAIFWFVTMIMLLGYLPDRAYYFTVQQTVDLGLLLWSPINFCPPSNVNLPCPAPVGATLPWQPSPHEIQLPAGRADGVAAVDRPGYLYAGGTDGKRAGRRTSTSRSAVGDGNLDGWKAAPPLPEARACRRRRR